MFQIFTFSIASHSAHLRGLLLCLTLTFAYIIYRAIYNLYLSPLSRFPGPKLWAVTKIPYNWHTIRGTAALHFIKLHEQYGDVIRYAPNHLSYISPDSWDAIYGPYKGKKHMEMDQAIFGGNVTVTGALQITNAINEDHRRLRHRFMRAMSAKAIVSQEPTLQKYAFQFIDGILSEMRGPSAIIDIAKWFSMATFDVISDLSFGKSFGCLDSGELHPWITVVFGAFKALPFLRVLREIPGVLWIGNHATFMLPRKLQKMWYEHYKYAFDLVEERIQNPQERVDFVHHIMQGDEEEYKLTHDEIKESAAQLVMAGSEPTATFLAGLCFYLAQSPTVYRTLVKEIRDSFCVREEITWSKTNQLPYLQAVIQEALRIFPPAPDVFPRLIPKGGEFVLGEFLPEGTSVAISALAACHSETNFSKPQTFDPQRWLQTPTDPKIAWRMKASQPFGQGHRSCLGKTLASAQIRLLMANLLWHFDISLLEEERDWLDRCRVFLGWEKPPLRMRLTITAEK